MNEQKKNPPKAPPSLTATASAIQSEIELYRKTEAQEERRARRKTVTAIILVSLCALATVALLVMILLANNGKIEPLPAPFVYAGAGSILAVLLIGLCFFAGSRDDKNLAAECRAAIDERRAQLAELKQKIEEEKRRKEEESMRVSETLAPISGTRSQKVAHALRVTSAVLSALSIPVAAIAAFVKDAKKKK